MSCSSRVTDQKNMGWVSTVFRSIGLCPGHNSAGILSAGGPLGRGREWVVSVDPEHSLASEPGADVAVHLAIVFRPSDVGSAVNEDQNWNVGIRTRLIHIQHLFRIGAIGKVLGDLDAIFWGSLQQRLEQRIHGLRVL